MLDFAPAKLKALRRERGLSRGAAAFAIGRSVDMYTRYEQGKNDPPAPVLGRLAEAFGCRVEDFFTEVESNG